MKKISINLIALVTGFLIFAIDQSTKVAALYYLKTRVVEVLGGFFKLNLIINKGVAFGFFPFFTKFIIAVNFIALMALLLVAVLKEIKPISLQIAIGMFMGGTAGNLLDRIRLGGVVDFIDFGWWPAFNVADMALTGGLFFILIILIKEKYI